MSANLLDNLDPSWIDVDVELIEEEDEDGVGWSFGETIMKRLEQEGIFVFDVENPQTTSDWEVVEAWPDLKHKLRRWRSHQR